MKTVQPQLSSKALHSPADYSVYLREDKNYLKNKRIKQALNLDNYFKSNSWVAGILL